MKKRKVKKTVIAKLILIICLIWALYFGYDILKWQKSVLENAKIKDEINSDIDIADGEYNIDFDKLKKKNPDIVAYLRVKGTNIDYIVVKGKDNDYYLNHNLYKKYNIAGWIFANYINTFDENDKNITIFGHNTKDGSMFGTLNKVLKSDWQKNSDNLEITLITEKGEYKYKVFSTYSNKAEDYYISNSFDGDEYVKFLNTIKSRSNYNYGIEISQNDKILTLSTCSGDGSKRVVLHAKLINN